MYIYIHIRCSQKTWMKSLRKSLHYLLNLKLFLKSLFLKESMSHKWPQYTQENTHTYTHTLRMIVICFSGEDFDLDQSLLWELRDTIISLQSSPSKEQRVLTSPYFLSVHRKNTLLRPYFIMKMRSRD